LEGDMASGEEGARVINLNLARRRKGANLQDENTGIHGD
jgi:hypothetical protein